MGGEEGDEAVGRVVAEGGDPNLMRWDRRRRSGWFLNEFVIKERIKRGKEGRKVNKSGDAMKSRRSRERKGGQGKDRGGLSGQAVLVAEADAHRR